MNYFLFALLIIWTVASCVSFGVGAVALEDQDNDTAGFAGMLAVFFLVMLYITAGFGWDWS